MTGNHPPCGPDGISNSTPRPPDLFAAIESMKARLKVSEPSSNSGRANCSQSAKPLPGPAHSVEANRLAHQCGLEPMDLDILTLAAGVELDVPFANSVAQAPDVPGTLPTVRLAQRVLAPEPQSAHRLAVRERFLADAPLRRHDLIRLADLHESDDNFRLSSSEFLIAHRTLQYLLGNNEVDPFIRLYVQLLDPTVTFETWEIPERLRTSIRTLLEGKRPGMASNQSSLSPLWPPGDDPSQLLLLISGSPGSGRQALAEAVASSLRQKVLLVSTADLCRESGDFGPMIRRIFREARLQNALPVFLNCTPFLPGDQFDADGFRILCAKLERYTKPTVLVIDRPLEFRSFPPNKTVLRADLPQPVVLHRETLWCRYLPPKGTCQDHDIKNLAKIFNFGGSGIQELVKEATNRALLRDGPEARLNAEDLMVAGRDIQSRKMGRYTRKMMPNMSLEDLILPDRVKKTIREIITTVRYRHVVYTDWGFGKKISTGKGLCVLFSGPPGTGKSMAAQVVSHELGMNLFRVNLARVVSKYIGETEENLAKVFEEARESHSVLLFDEADALFAKRTKVKSAQDRYANLEVNFLLQEVEGFEGMVILTTNLETSIDKAFKRRLNYRVFFPFPDADARTEIWQRLFPPQAPLEPDIDWNALGEDFEFSGGYIKNAVIRAAQWAAETDGVITMESLFRAAEVELTETGRLVRESTGVQTQRGSL